MASGFRKYHRISIHASLREATCPTCAFPRSRIYFNSRLSARGYCHTSLKFWVFCISIHASLREATLKLKFSTFIIRYFNSRLSARGYKVLTVSTRQISNFNSRLSARGYSKNRQYIAVFQLNFCLISLLYYIHSIIL